MRGVMFAEGVADLQSLVALVAPAQAQAQTQALALDGERT